MGRVYGEPAEVQAHSDGRPARFAWRGRLYSVRAVTGHWIVSREWWTDPDPGPAQPGMEFWRVEAAAGQGFPLGTYELRRDMAAGSWTLRGVVD